MVEVYVITNIGVCGDCIIGVFCASGCLLEKLKERFPEDEGYTIHGNLKIEENLYAFEGD